MALSLVSSCLPVLASLGQIKRGGLLVVIILLWVTGVTTGERFMVCELLMIGGTCRVLKCFFSWNCLLCQTFGGCFVLFAEVGLEFIGIIKAREAMFDFTYHCNLHNFKSVIETFNYGASAFVIVFFC